MQVLLSSWYTFAENRWYTITESCWYSYGRLLTAWEEVTGALGFIPLDLWRWDYNRLRELLMWMNKGVTFGQEQNGTAWTSGGLSNVLDGLNATEKLMQDSGGTLMNFLGGNLVLIASAEAYPSDRGARALGWHNLIYFNNGSPSLQLFLHELGHIVDWHLGGNSSYWSNTGLSGWSTTPSGKITADPNLSSLASYSTASPLEDFADTFAASAISNAGQPLPSGMKLNITRFNDLKSALSTRFYILEQ